MAREEKDKTEVGITGKKIPKPGSAKKQYELEKKRRMGKHLGKNVGGEKYSSDVNPYFNPRSVREEVLLDYLLDEGFASDEKSAQAIVGAMSEEWKQSIMEGPGGMMMSAASKGRGKVVITPPHQTPQPKPALGPNPTKRVPGIR
jgi:hypothetical protein